MPGQPSSNAPEDSLEDLTGFRNLSGLGLPILTFHALDEASDVLAFPPRVLRYGLEQLHAAGYRSLRLSEAVDLVQSGAALPERAVVLTFDDGYRSVYEVALPLLQDLGMTATVFLLPDMVVYAGRPLLGWHEIRSLLGAGFEPGAHSLTHPDLTRLSDRELETEVVGGKARIEDRLGAPVTSFAYPFGRYDQRSLALARQHFSCACSTRLGLVTPRSDPHALERMETYYLRTERLFDLMLSPAWPWYLRVRGFLRAARERVLRLHPWFGVRGFGRSGDQYRLKPRLQNLSRLLYPI